MSRIFCGAGKEHPTNTNVINKVTSPPPLPCGVVEFTPQGKPSPLEGEGRVRGKKN
jgi:hypothetical protein